VQLPRIIRSASTGAERLLDRVLCVLGAVLFSQVPEFMQQYLQRLGGHLDEARLTISRFRDAAAQSGSTLDLVIAGSAQNPDPSMRNIGGVIQGAITRADHLAAADEALRSASVWTRPFVFLRHVDWGIAKATWEIYRPAVPTTAEGFIYAGVGVIFALSIYYLGVKAPIAAHYRRKAAKAAGAP
jgi:hypothetical protein